MGASDLLKDNLNLRLKTISVRHWIEANLSPVIIVPLNLGNEAKVWKFNCNLFKNHQSILTWISCRYILYNCYSLVYLKTIFHPATYYSSNIALCNTSYTLWVRICSVTEFIVFNQLSWPKDRNNELIYIYIYMAHLF